MYQHLHVGVTLRDLHWTPLEGPGREPGFNMVQPPMFHPRFPSFRRGHEFSLRIDRPREIGASDGSLHSRSCGLTFGCKSVIPSGGGSGDAGRSGDVETLGRKRERWVGVCWIWGIKLANQLKGECGFM